MNTRTKIVPIEEAERIAAGGATVVSGYFDPVLASHAERLRGLKREGAALLVLIHDPSNPILPGSARAELVAGLAVVDHVVYQPAQQKESITPQVRLDREHETRLEELIERVHARQRAAS